MNQKPTNFSRLVALANEAAIADEALVGLSNELTAATGDGWARIAYGEWPHEEGIQVFDRASAEEITGYFKNAWNTIKRAVSGLPIYNGHPDLVNEVRKVRSRTTDTVALANIDQRIAGLLAQYPDKANYGAIADMEARADGLYIKPVLADTGTALVNDGGRKFFSPHWLARKMPPRDGKPVFSPALMLSIGLTDRPNIAGTSLVNSAPNRAADKIPQTNPVMNKLVIALLAALGRPLANEATETQISEALTAVTPVAASLLTRPEPTALANEQSARTIADAKVIELTTALANEKTAHQATVTARNTALVDGQIRAGKIKEADKAVWLGRLSRDFAAESVALANEQGGVKTTPRTGSLGDRSVVNTARDQFTALVNDRVSKGATWNDAWEATRVSAAGKPLYEQMGTKA